MKAGRILLENFSNSPSNGTCVLLRNKVIKFDEDVDLKSVKNVVVKCDSGSYPILECQWEKYARKIGEHVQFDIVIFENKDYAAIIE